MEPFPALADLPVFEGKVISLISFYAYQLNFTIEDEVSVPGSAITIGTEHVVEHRDTDGTIWLYDCQADVRSPVVLHRLIYKPIVAVEREDFRFTFQIQGGVSLSILSELGMYECGQFVWDNHVVIF